MKKISVIVFLCLFLVACLGKDKPKKPNNLISQDNMEQILYDLYIINAAKGVNRKILENQGLVPETYVLTKYKIDSTQFADSNAYYAFDSETYKKIVEKVKARLETEKKEFEELEKIEGQAAKRRRDSISKANRAKQDSIKTALKGKTIN